jgi:hypothetical protein
LYFPLPVTDCIENFVKVRNLENAKLAFRVRATNRRRYGVKPAIGYLHPKEETLIRFLLDPQEMTVDGRAPDESTSDAFVLEFVFVSDDDVAHQTPKEYWGQLQNTSICTRKKLVTVFTKGEVPGHLRVRRLEGSPSASRVPSWSALTTPELVETPQVKVSALDQARAPAEGEALAVGPRNHDRPPFLKSVFFFRIPVPIAAALVIASIVVALFEENTPILDWSVG